MKRTLERFLATAIALAIVTSFGAALTFVPSGAAQPSPGCAVFS